jgi:hypothetical protein
VDVCRGVQPAILEGDGLGHVAFSGSSHVCHHVAPTLQCP